MGAFRGVGLVVMLTVVAAGPAVAQGRGHGRGSEQAPGQARKAERERQTRFQDRDRDIVRNWYDHERRGGAGLPPGLRRRELPPGLRDRDRLPPGLEARLVPGYVIEADLRPRLFPVPAELLRQLAPPPTGFRLFAFGGHIVLVDAAFRLADVIRMEVSVGR